MTAVMVLIFLACKIQKTVYSYIYIYHVYLSENGTFKKIVRDIG